MAEMGWVVLAQTKQEVFGRKTAGQVWQKVGWAVSGRQVVFGTASGRFRQFRRNKKSHPQEEDVWVRNKIPP